MNKLSVLYKLGLLWLIVMCCVSCNGQQQYGSPEEYDLSNPVKYNMPNGLTEISGIAFHQDKANMLYAVQDEVGRVYYLDLNDMHPAYTKFEKKGDYEDISIMGDQVVVLRSNGSMYVFPFNQIGKPVAAGVQNWHNLLPLGEYEGMYADERTSQLYVLCKSCSDMKASKTGGGFIFKLSPTGTLKQTGQFAINVSDIEKLLNKKKIQFLPSALAKNPRTNEWYILSSANRALVITDAAWKVKAAYSLPASLFLQPEGIAFDSQNNLYISNEGDNVTKGTVLKFTYKK